MKTNRSVSIILPCHNEEAALPICLDQILEVIDKNELNTEIILINNKSTDGTNKILSEYKNKFSNIKILHENNLGYGHAYLKGLSEASEENIFLADADASYDFNEIPNFIDELEKGSDLVVGNRFSKKIESGVMPSMHKYIGNPLLSRITRVLFNIKIKDIHCGARAIKRSSYKKLNLQATGMEFASEMIVLASKKKMKIREIPISYHSRIGTSKLKPFRDGWRHLRFLLLNSPLALFLLPGSTLFLLGLIFTFLLYFTQISIGSIQLYFHPMFLTAILMIVGYQLMFFSIFAKTYSVVQLGEEDEKFEKIFKYINISKVGVAGIISTIIGLIILITIFHSWINSNFNEINQVKNSMIALIFIVLGIQTLSSAFMLSILSIKSK